MKRFACWALLIPLLSGCPRSDTITVTPCAPRVLLPEVRLLLPNRESQAHLITIARDYVLALYLCDPTLDRGAAGDAVAYNTRRAVLYGARQAQAIVRRLPCIASLCTAINPMVVDAAQNVWYIDILPMGTLTALTAPDDEELLAAVTRQSAEYSYRRNQRVQGDQAAAARWEQTREKLASVIVDTPERLDWAAYRLCFNHESLVQVYWEVFTPDEGEEARVLARADGLKTALADCLPDKLEIYLTDPEGRTRAFGTLERARLETSGPIEPKSFILHRMY